MGMRKKIFGLKKKKQNSEQSIIIPASCTVTHEAFDIVLGYKKGRLTMLHGVKSMSVFNRDIKNQESKGLKTLELSDGLVTGRLYKCPICGNRDIVRCGACHRITCYDGNGKFKCAHCGNSGQVSGTMKSVDALYNSSGLKEDGLKLQSGTKYYPGDK